MFASELLVMVVANLHKSSRESLPALRLVSKKFNSIIIPITYQSIKLTPDLIKDLSSNLEAEVHHTADWQVTQDICRYTRHITIRETVDWEVTNKLIRSMDKLESFTRVLRSCQTRERTNND